MVLPDPPLAPSGDDARSLLRRELLHPEYHHDNLLVRLVEWIQRLLGRGLTAAREAPPLSTFAAMLVGLLLIAGIVWLLGRARRSAAAPDRSRTLLTGEVVTAAQLRIRAEHALREERFADALVDGFRAAALRQIERDRIDDIPGATAHEVALALAEANPSQAAEVHRCATLFDLVLYGGRPATRAQANETLALDEGLDHRAAPRVGAR